MLFVKNTSHLTGITVHGDYQDLNSLYDGLHRYLAFYFQNGTGDEYVFYETLLVLCYDIRHAFQGDRNTESTENNAENIGMLASCIYQVDEQNLASEREKYAPGNLYFNVEILYPLALFYLFSLQNILDDWYCQEWFEQLDFPYDPLDMQRDRTTIQLFLDMLWVNLRDTLGKKSVHALHDYFDENSNSFSCHSLYAECLCQFYVSQTKKLSSDMKKQYLLAICYQLVSPIAFIDHPEQYPQCSTDYQQAMGTVMDSGQLPLYSYYDFYGIYNGYFCDNRKELTEETQEEFIMKYFGIVDWEHIEW